MAGRTTARLLWALLLGCPGFAFAQSPGNPVSDGYAFEAAAYGSDVNHAVFPAPMMQGGPQGYGPYAPPPPGDVSFSTNPNDPAWDYDDNSPLDRFLHNVFKNSWVRFDYLLWDYSNPGNVLLGAPILGIKDPSQPFPVALPNPTVARVPTLAPMSLSDQNGVRGTFGIDFQESSLEVNYFDLQQGDDSIRANELPSPQPPNIQTWVATSVSINGQVTNVGNLFFYDQDFTARLTSDLRGAEVTIIKGPKFSAQLFNWRPIFGFQWRRFEEHLTQRGVFFDTATNQNLVSIIGARASNNMFAPHVGVRAEVNHKWFTLGVEPRFALGVNQYSAFTITQQLRNFNDPTVITTDRNAKISPLFELAAYAKVHLDDRWSFFIGYNLIYAWEVTRPFNNIYYNDNGPLTTPAIVQRTNFGHLTIQGLTIGGELRFR